MTPARDPQEAGSRGNRAAERLVIAIDGPSGSGKSSTARGVATKAGLAFLDTGSMYRALTVAALERGIPISDADAISELAASCELSVGTDPAAPSIAVDGVDVTAAIREPRVSAQVSGVATNPEVRTRLTTAMRELIEASHGMVVEGRDITTVVYPQAPVRVLLVADPAARTQRRAAELAGVSAAEITDQVIRRDRDDATVSQFETPAPGVHLIDSTHLSLAEVIEQILALVPIRWWARDGDPSSQASPARHNRTHE